MTDELYNITTDKEKWKKAKKFLMSLKLGTDKANNFKNFILQQIEMFLKQED